MTKYNNNLIFREVILRNFLSFGNRDEIVRLDQDLVSVVLGENLDSGGEDSRNGCGKSAIIDAICYCLFGRTLRELPNQGLIHDLAARGHSMYTKVTFDKGKYSYLVERGEKPSRLLFLRKPRDSKEDFYTREKRKLKFDFTRGASKTETTKVITNLLGQNLALFSYLVANSSESTPFLKLREDQRREVSEALFGFSILSERAERLKKIRKMEKEILLKEETAFSTKVAANQRVESQIEDMERRSKAWEARRQATIQELEETIATLREVDIDAEIETLSKIGDLNTRLKDVTRELDDLQRQYTSHEDTKTRSLKEIERLEGELAEAEGKMKDLEESRCPTCKQHWEPDPEYRGQIESFIADVPETMDQYRGDIKIEDDSMEEIEGFYVETEGMQVELSKQLNELKELELTFESTEDAAEGRASLKALEDTLAKEEQEVNPHTESIDSLKKEALVDVAEDETSVKTLKKRIRHFNFLIELLTSKDSFVRKRIIDQWLPKLNERIAFYLDILELPHTVEFQPDLTVNIIKFQKEKYWGSLSKGERARLNIALNFAFQDIFEYMNYEINLLCIDELIDNGICPRGAERTVDLIKGMAAERHKRTFLITHRDDIAARVDHMLIVQKENEFSKIIEEE